MTIWDPDLGSFSGPKYRRVADALASAVDSGELPPGSRLPTHRELADRLGFTVGTVTRAYDEARKRGLVSGEVGRGTFVRDREADLHGGSGPFGVGHVEEGVVDLALNLPVCGVIEARFSASFSRVTEQSGAAWIYHPPGGTASQRQVGAQWILERSGLEASPDDIVITNGAQQAILVALSVLAERGDVVLTENLTYPGMTAAARWLGLKLESVPLDRDGLIPEALDEACRRHRPRALFCLPTLQNPTGVTMSDARRCEVLEVADRHNLGVIEDDTYRFLARSAPEPLAAHKRGRVWYLTTLSKSVVPGLRIAFLRTPAGEAPRAREAVMATTWTATPLTAELARAWIADGTALEILDSRVREARRRRKLIRKHLAEFVDFDLNEHAMHLWIETPEPWRAADFVEATDRLC